MPVFYMYTVLYSQISMEIQTETYSSLKEIKPTLLCKKIIFKIKKKQEEEGKHFKIH